MSVRHQFQPKTNTCTSNIPGGGGGGSPSSAGCGGGGPGGGGTDGGGGAMNTGPRSVLAGERLSSNSEMDLSR